MALGSEGGETLVMVMNVMTLLNNIDASLLGASSIY